MKTLRIVCYACAGYYGLQCLVFATSAMTGKAMKGLMPAGLPSDSIIAMQEERATVMAAFAPYLLIGAALCLLMALQAAQLRKIIPVLAGLLLAGGVVWCIAFLQVMARSAYRIDDFMGDAPAFVRGWMHFAAGIGNWSMAAMALVPGVLILAFWRKAARQAATV